MDQNWTVFLEHCCITSASNTKKFIFFILISDPAGLQEKTELTDVTFLITQNSSHLVLFRTVIGAVLWIRTQFRFRLIRILLVSWIQIRNSELGSRSVRTVLFIKKFKETSKKFNIYQILWFTTYLTTYNLQWPKTCPGKSGFGRIRY